MHQLDKCVQLMCLESRYSLNSTPSWLPKVALCADSDLVGIAGGVARRAEVDSQTPPS